MNIRENILAILHYEGYDKLPLIHFGYWFETLEKWFQEGHITKEEFKSYHGDGSPGDIAIAKKLGFNFNWQPTFGGHCSLSPFFKREVIEELPNGGRKVVDQHGVIVLEKPGLVSIPQEFDHLLKDRESWGNTTFLSYNFL